MKSLLLLFAFSFLLWPSQAANIAVYIPFPFYSHQIAFRPLWLELARRGHHITLIQPNVIVENNENVSHIVLNDTFAIMNTYGVLDKLSRGESIVKLMTTVSKTLEETINYHLEHPEVRSLLNGEKKIDLLFTEVYAPVGVGIGYKLNASVIGVVSMDGAIYNHLLLGNPTHPVAYPDINLQVSGNPTLMERIQRVLYWVGVQAADCTLMTPYHDYLFKKHFGVMPPMREMVKNISLLFTNTNPLFGNVRPLGPKTINIGGGLHIMKPKPLPKEIQEYLDESANGAIFFSLGSSLKGKFLQNATRKIILETFSELPYNILWKLDEKLENIPPNVKMMTWVPQQDLLRHKNVKLFITQAGLQSVEEAILSHVPMIALPFFGDQLGNAKKIVDKGFGLSFDHTKLEKETFKSAIFEVMHNPKYREKTKELADLVRDQPMTSVEKAVWWTEYVLRHGNTYHFRDPMVDLPWYQFLLLDIICIFLIVAATCVYSLIKTVQILKYLLFKVFSRRKMEKIKTG